MDTRSGDGRDLPDFPGEQEVQDPEVLREDTGNATLAAHAAVVAMPAS